MIIALSIMGLIGLLGLVAYLGRKAHLDQQVRKLEKKMKDMSASFRALSMPFEAVSESGERFSRTIELPMIVVGLDIGVENGDRSAAVILYRDPESSGLRVIHESEEWRNFRCKGETDEHSF